jgi:hypothetical protein
MVRRLLLSAFLSTAIVLGLTAPARAHNETFPMKGAEYKQREETRLARYQERLEERMKQHAVAATKREDARKRMAAIVTELRAAAERAASDGLVTESEAKEIKALSKQRREALYRDLGFERAKGE